MKNIPIELKREVDIYLDAKPDDDIDMVNEVRELLTKSGLQLKLSDGFDNNRFIIDAIGKSSTVQRYLLNRYWTQQLATINKNTIEERYSLIPDGDCADWLKIFESTVLPTVIENDLPVKISDPLRSTN